VLAVLTKPKAFTVLPLLLNTLRILVLVEALKESEVVINQLTSERNDQAVWDPIATH
jgi:hypothetical protein